MSLDQRLKTARLLLHSGSALRGLCDKFRIRKERFTPPTSSPSFASSASSVSCPPSSALRFLRLLRLFAANPSSAVRPPSSAVSPPPSALRRSAPDPGVARRRPRSRPQTSPAAGGRPGSRPSSAPAWSLQNSNRRSRSRARLLATTADMYSKMSAEAPRRSTGSAGWRSVSTRASGGSKNARAGGSDPVPAAVRANGRGKTA